MSYTYTTKRDLIYSTPGGIALHLDLDIPHKSAPRPLPLVVYLPGGNWTQCAYHGGVPVREARRGYAVAHVQYRLSSQALFPAQIADVRAAIRWLRLNAALYEIDPDRIAVWGFSAGGHLASLAGTAGDDITILNSANLANFRYPDKSIVSCEVAAVVDWFGPIDFLSEDQQRDANYPLACQAVPPYCHNCTTSGESMLLGGPVQRLPGKAAQANPMTYITSDDASFLIMHGEDDCRVPLQQSINFYSALVAAGVEASFESFPDTGHGGGWFLQASTLEKVDAFLDSKLLD